MRKYPGVVQIPVLAVNVATIQWLTVDADIMVESRLEQGILGLSMACIRRLQLQKGSG